MLAPPRVSARTDVTIAAVQMPGHLLQCELLQDRSRLTCPPKSPRRLTHILVLEISGCRRPEPAFERRLAQ
jgi:hypothetical protein